MSGKVRKSGGCQCGRVRYSVEVDPAEAYLCHCRMCQRATGGFAASFVSVKRGDIDWEGEPDLYASSSFAKRPFCSNCGTPLGFGFDEGSENYDLTVGSFDDPADFRPKHHFGAESMLHESWLDTMDLKRIRTDEHDLLMEKWRASGEAPPSV